MPDIEIPEHEQGVTRVFSLSMAPAEARKLKGSTAEAAATLGLSELRETGVEVFRIADLGDLGLVGYLLEGVDAQAADINRDRAKLAALDGWVMLVHSSAFGGAAATLTPSSELTLIGSYRQQGATKTPIDIASEAAQPYSGPPPSPIEAKGRSGKGGSAVVLGLAVLALIILWAAFR